MGICYGHQLLCRSLVGKSSVRKSPKGLEEGWCEMSFSLNEGNLEGVRENEKVFQSHFDEVIQLPEGSTVFATNNHTRIQAFVNVEQKLLGTQFHPEFTREQGNDHFLKEKDLMQRHGLFAEEIIKSGPTFNTGPVFFNHFLSVFAELSL